MDTPFDQSIAKQKDEAVFLKSGRIKDFTLVNCSYSHPKDIDPCIDKFISSHNFTRDGYYHSVAYHCERMVWSGFVSQKEFPVRKPHPQSKSPNISLCLSVIVVIIVIQVIFSMMVDHPEDDCHIRNSQIVVSNLHTPQVLLSIYFNHFLSIIYLLNKSLTMKDHYENIFIS